MNQVIDWKIIDKIGHLILNDPPTNKMSTKFFEELKDLVLNVIPVSGIDAIIIYGEGRHFSQGADLDDLLNHINNNTVIDDNGMIVRFPEFLIENNKSFIFFKEIKVPVIAAITGVCLGSALELVLFCDFRICSENSIFGFPESTFNLMPGCGGTQNILKYAKISKAIELMLKGSTFSAEEALQMKIVNCIVPKKEVINTAIRIAKDIQMKINKKKQTDKIKGDIARIVHE